LLTLTIMWLSGNSQTLLRIFSLKLSTVVISLTHGTS
jgi:hypothetical protein